MPLLQTPKKTKTQQTDPAGLDERIRRRAYELYEQRNRAGGHEVDDWQQAEAELTGKKTKTTAA